MQRGFRATRAFDLSGTLLKFATSAPNDGEKKIQPFERLQTPLFSLRDIAHRISLRALLLLYKERGKSQFPTEIPASKGGVGEM